MKDRYVLILVVVIGLTLPVVRLLWGYPPQFFGPGGGDTIQPTYINERGQTIAHQEKRDCVWFPFVFSGMPAILMVAPTDPKPEELFAPVIGLVLWTVIASAWEDRWWAGFGFATINIVAGFGVGLMVWGILVFLYMDNFLYPPVQEKYL